MLKKLCNQIGLFARKERKELTITNWDFVGELRRRGYSSWTCQAYGEIVESCRRWLATRQVVLCKLSENELAGFLRAYRAKGRRRRWRPYRLKVCRRALQRWLALLREQGLVPQRADRPATELERLLREYDGHLERVRGLAAGTRRNLQDQARRFLHWLARRGGVALRQVGPKQVLSYAAQCARAFPPATARKHASGLRTFLRFLAWSRRVRPWLDRAVPALAPWPRPEVPRGLAEGQYRRLLASFDRRTAMGCRDYAIARFLGELGLRANEVAALRLEDVDWHQGLLCLPKTKQRRERQVPLPAPVARALGQYLLRARPRSSCRAVFLRHRPPLDQGLSASQVGWAMSRGFARSGISARGAHVLRYSLATRLQRRGVGLKAIADLLGHRSLQSTFGYARVDWEALRQVALPWPEGRR